jgi:hypothetical protein
MHFRAFKGRQNNWHTTMNLPLSDCFHQATDHTAIGFKTRLMRLSLILIHHAATPVHHHSSSILKAGCHV